MKCCIVLVLVLVLRIQGNTVGGGSGVVNDRVQHS